MKKANPIYQFLHIFVILTILISLIPTTGVSAQSATLKLHPSSGNAPTVRGTLSGSGWCNPASSVSVSGPGVSGSASIGRDGSLSGNFSVTGKAGDKVKISVSAVCRAGSGKASAVFKFKGGPTSTPIPAPITFPTSTFTNTPTATATSTSTPTFTPTFTPTLTFTPTPVENPDNESDPIVPYSGTNTLTILGCDPQPEDVQLSFRKYLGDTAITGQPIPIAVDHGDQPGLFIFDPPQADPGSLFAIDLQLTSSDCPPGEEEGIDTWTPGSSVQVTFGGLAGSSLMGSSLGKFAPGSIQQEITLKGIWTTNIMFSTTPQGHTQLFQWSNPDPNIVSAKLQVSIMPFPSTTDGDLLNPPGLVADWDVTCGNCEFSVDTSVLAFDEPEKSQSQSKIVNFFQQTLQLLKKDFSLVLTWIKTQFGNQSPADTEVTLLDKANQQPSNIVNMVDSGKIQPPLITTFYFRVVPKSENKIAGAASNQVKIQWYGLNQAAEAIKQAQECLNNPETPGCPSPMPPLLKPYTIEIIGYHGIIPPQDGHVGGYVVTKDTTIQVGPNKLEYKAGQVIPHPEPKEKKWYEAVVDFALDVVNWVSTAYSDMKDTVISIVAQFVPDELCGKDCLDTLLDAGLMALGIPPSIPNFDQLMNQGLDYLAAQAVGELGFPPEIYDSIDPNLSGLAAEVAISEVEAAWKAEAEKQIKEGLQQGLEAAQYSLSEKVSWIPNGVPIKPDPLGDFQPPTLMLKVTRNPDVPIEADYCISKPSYKGNLWILSNVNVTPDTADEFNNDINNKTKSQQMKANYSYYLYESKFVPLPYLNLGESQVIPVVLQPTINRYFGAPWTSFNNAQSAWGTWYWNGEMDLSVNNPCSNSDSIQGSPDQSFGQ